MNARAIETEFAFPRDRDTHPLAGGLTKREYFAAMTLQGLAGNPNVIAYNTSIGWKIVNTDESGVAHAAMDFADALIAALKETT